MLAPELHRPPADAAVVRGPVLDSRHNDPDHGIESAWRAEINHDDLLHTAGGKPAKNVVQVGLYVVVHQRWQHRQVSSRDGLSEIPALAIERGNPTRVQG